MSAGFLGAGWRFPILPDPAGGLGYAVGEASIEACLIVLVQTAAGERVMRPELGTRVPELVFAPGSVANLRAIEVSISDAVRDYEPRVDLDAVVAEADPRDPSVVTVSIDYRVRRSNTAANLVFPFYLGGSA